MKFGQEVSTLEPPGVQICNVLNSKKTFKDKAILAH